jgi:hypothetical protein
MKTENQNPEPVNKTKQPWDSRLLRWFFNPGVATVLFAINFIGMLSAGKVNFLSLTLLSTLAAYLGGIYGSRWAVEQNAGSTKKCEDGTSAEQS